MPFTKENASSAGKIGGVKGMAVRWGDKDPATVRNVKMMTTLTQYETDEITAKARAIGLSRTELIVRACRAYNP
ncbi:MAG: hypothetical protein FWH42_03165 [Dehalococcoidia bacterium]|nr:hypothetical protein [Dehalococcoidia bacterium]